MDFFRSFGRNWFEYAFDNQTYLLGERSLSGNEANELYRNDGRQFTRVGLVNGAGCKLDARGFVPADLDRDGDLDLLLVNNAQPLAYLENHIGQKRNWCVVQLEGPAPNRFGVGARLRLEAGGRSQLREIHVGSGFLSSPAPEAHFGLGDATAVERLTIRWPDGREQELRDLPANCILIVDERGARPRHLQSP